LVFVGGHKVCRQIRRGSDVRRAADSDVITIEPVTDDPLVSRLLNHDTVWLIHFFALLALGLDFVLVRLWLRVLTLTLTE
jgi:predicted nucleotidyltransferase